MAFVGSDSSSCCEMDVCFPTRVKRKDLEGGYDEFSDFSLSSSAKKLRRLDANLRPTMEEEPVVPEGFGRLPKEEAIPTLRDPSLPSNEGSAIVLYKPVNSRELGPYSSSEVSFLVDWDFINTFNDQVFQMGLPNPTCNREKEAASADERPTSTSNCLAVIPWDSSSLPDTSNVTMDSVELMESEEREETAAMDVEEKGVEARKAGVVGNQGSGYLHQWQQHCMTSQPTSNSSSPIMWS